jgi:hypothetical protein
MEEESNIKGMDSFSFNMIYRQQLNVTVILYN